MTTLFPLVGDTQMNLQAIDTATAERFKLGVTVCWRVYEDFAPHVGTVVAVVKPGEDPKALRKSLIKEYNATTKHGGRDVTTDATRYFVLVPDSIKATRKPILYLPSVPKLEVHGVYCGCEKHAS
jgi:hypothetical protein